tara:strand:+ start:2699 stop:3145 length:447 start_codon:yes stop_codon:yes gene_type:complete
MKFILAASLLLFSCKDISINKNSFNSKENLNELINSYVFLSETHDLLHVMMGEYEGSPIDSYMQYKNQIATLNDNFYLRPIFLGLDNIIISDNNMLINADKFDALVDYYQIGMQMMIEGILKGYGYDGKMPQNTKEYELIKTINFNNK